MPELIDRWSVPRAEMRDVTYTRRRMAEDIRHIARQKGDPVVTVDELRALGWIRSQIERHGPEATALVDLDRVAIVDPPAPPLQIGDPVVVTADVQPFATGLMGKRGRVKDISRPQRTSDYHTYHVVFDDGEDAWFVRNLLRHAPPDPDPLVAAARAFNQTMAAFAAAADRVVAELDRMIAERKAGP